MKTIFKHKHLNPKWILLVFSNLLLSQLFAQAGKSNKSATVFNPIEETIHPYLSNTDECAVEEIPVVIIRYLPTQDGINLDVTKAPDYWSLGETSLETMKARIDAFDLRVKFNLEEGSKFRGYKNPDAVPYLGYLVIKYITVYETTPRGEIAFYRKDLPVYKIDYHQIFERFNLEHYINDLGVKEVWLWNAPFEPSYPSYDPNIHHSDDFRQGNESNMSSPTSGDISNSYRDNSDLPIYNHTYILYEQNIRRSQAEAVHNRGHQLEAMFSHLNRMQDGNTDLFWKKFVGQNASGNFITGRAGWTHMPPNTTKDYDYLNTILVESDIEDWTPDESGLKESMNVNRWANIPYSWPGEADFFQKTESQWYLYWMQSMPGFGNKISYNGNYLSNWWDLYANWDNAIINKKGLHSNEVAPDNSSLQFSEVLNLTDIINTGKYRAQETIVSNSQIVDDHAVIYQAGKNIELLAGFCVHAGCQFTATIKSCSITSSFLQERSTQPLTTNNNSKEIIAFPNPTTGRLQLKGLETGTVKIINQFGTILLNQKIQNNEIDLSTLPNGMYFLHFDTKQYQRSQKIVKIGG